jgi:hypothetical protein
LTQRAPDFFIIGQPKCGTTALYEMLRRHPQIFMPELKEPYYLADELANYPPPVDLPTTLSEYLALFAPAAPGQLTGEATVFYLWSDTAARNIAQVRPDARVIVMLREPASLLHSMHRHFVRHYMETEKNLRTALALEDHRRHGRHLPQEGYWPFLLIYSEHIKYVDQLRRYREALSDDQILILIYDDFRVDNDATIRSILRFLGVDDSVSISKIEANQSTRVRARGVEKAMNALSQGGGPGLSIVKTVVDTVTTQRLRSTARRAISRHVVYGKPLPPDRDLVMELQRRYKPEVEALADYLGRDLITLWGYNEIE